MSLARIHTTKTVRKDWVCGKCGKTIKKGVDGRISFSVGFRGRERTRCTDTACYPTRAERESSMVADIYAAMDSVDYSKCNSLDDLTEAVGEVMEACEGVASEYESSEMFERNEDLQERAETLRRAAEDLEAWANDLEDEPDTEDEDAHEAWLADAREAAENAVEEVELP